jgi:DNA-binding CsgD family transcriptional regulator
MGLGSHHRTAAGDRPPRAAVRTAAELRIAGFRPRRARFSGGCALTPSERRVAVLAVSGVTNGDIAWELFVTTRTGEVHLSSAYRMLSASGREELPRGSRARADLGPCGQRRRRTG